MGFEEHQRNEWKFKEKNREFKKFYSCLDIVLLFLLVSGMILVKKDSLIVDRYFYRFFLYNRTIHI